MASVWSPDRMSTAVSVQADQLLRTHSRQGQAIDCKDRHLRIEVGDRGAGLAQSSRDRGSGSFGQVRRADLEPDADEEHGGTNKREAEIPQTLPKAGNNKSRQGRHRFSHAIQERCLDGLMASEGTKQVEIVAKAVSADAGARVEAHVAVRLGGRSFRHLARGDTQAVRQARDLADQTDAGGEEGVLQQLREFGHLGR